MFENIKLISSDIDGTLVDSSREMNKATLQTIKDIRSQGYLFGFASGRPLRDVQITLEKWGAKDQYDFIIAWNGCEILDNLHKQEYQYNILTKAELEEIVTFMSHYDCNVHMYYRDQYLSSSNTDRAWYSAFRNKREFIVCQDLSIFSKQDCPGIMFRIKKEDASRIEHDLELYCQDKNYLGFKTQPDLIEFSNKNSNKGFALKKISELYHIPLTDIMSFGDTSNDNSMLAVSYGVCLLNGSDDTKKCAKMITAKTVDENGFTDFVNTYLLKPLR